MTRVSSRSVALSSLGSTLQTAANRMAAAIRPPDRGAAMFARPTARAAAVNNAFGAVVRRRRKSRARKRKLKKAAGVVRRRATRRAARHAKFVKGSAAAKRHMAALRKLRKRRS